MLLRIEIGQELIRNEVGATIFMTVWRVIADPKWLLTPSEVATAQIERYAVTGLRLRYSLLT